MFHDVSWLQCWIYWVIYQLDQAEPRMRRLSTPRKSSKDFPQSQLSSVVNSLLMGNLNTQQHCTFLTVSTAPQYKSYRTNDRPSTKNTRREQSQEAQPKILRSTNLTDFHFKSESAERKGLRPKTSLVSSKISYNSAANSIEKKYESMKHPFSAKRSTSHETTEQRAQQEQKVQIKLVENQSNLQKLVSKPPKSITSNKSVGLIRGYSVNSHKFFLLGSQISEARILVIANLTKTSRIDSIISLYAIFQSTNSPVFVDFLRENFQTEVSKLLEGFPTPPITKQLVEKSLLRVQQRFYQYYKIKPRTAKRGNLLNHFGLSFSLMFSQLEQINFFTKGATQISFSSNFGAKLSSFHTQNIEMRTLQGKQLYDLDFVMLTSEGASSASRHTLREIWFTVLKTISSNEYQINASEGQEIHNLLGGALDSLMQRFSTLMTFKNMSVVLCGLKNFQQTLCEENLQNLELPYADSGKNQKGQQQQKDDFQTY